MHMLLLAASSKKTPQEIVGVPMNPSAHFQEKFAVALPPTTVADGEAALVLVLVLASPKNPLELFVQSLLPFVSEQLVDAFVVKTPAAHIAIAIEAKPPSDDQT